MLSLINQLNLLEITQNSLFISLENYAKLSKIAPFVNKFKHNGSEANLTVFPV